jgi:hypothetical protein
MGAQHLALAGLVGGEEEGVVQLAGRMPGREVERGEVVEMAAATRSRRPLISGPCTRRSSGLIEPSDFRRSEMAPVLPSASTRTASSAARSAAPAMRAERSASRESVIGWRS